ncbi:MAG: tRNA (adenosine(37)-N6)-threonylcarbamoyltransferase complex transferase subunit TsaD [Bacteroidetes bacterium QS_8_64_10]|nr:MAG: tRNA (adenosine(37)-N6)-threonylcarbamoyltransferase complex transferase subunit TsaD [Bacteroidetes bacterium QS_8_64_10]
MPMSHVLLGLESSCDDTAAAVLVEGELRASVVSSQADHEKYGGVVPEVASRAHQRLVVPVARRALREAGVAKALALGLDVPFTGVNYLEGHLFSVMIEEPRPPFPHLNLIASGGHTQLVLVREPFRYEVLGRTRDDAAGEAFDKVAQLVGLSYPGGPEIDRLAERGDAGFHDFPRSRPGDYDFSFSGLKTSVRYYLDDFADDERAVLLDEHRADLCASFQQAVVDVLVGALRRGMEETGVEHVAVTGGVSANTALRRQAEALCDEAGACLHVPPMKFCMDNAAMIAVAGYHRLQHEAASPLSLSVQPRLALPGG